MVTAYMNSILLKPLTQNDVKQALFQMSTYKSLGLNAYFAYVFQVHQETIVAKVCNMVLEILNSGTSLTSINQTYINVIPKLKKSTKLIDCHPINLCDVVYKIISKLLVSRLKLILLQIVSTHQSAFNPLSF